MPINQLSQEVKLTITTLTKMSPPLGFLINFRDSTNSTHHHPCRYGPYISLSAHQRFFKELLLVAKLGISYRKM